MALVLFNTLTRKKEIFEPIRNKSVGFYSCGPTVYWHPHIGNMRTYVFNDILKRVLAYNGFKVRHVMNYTDVGHLTSDADEGEDKIEEAAKKEKKTAKEIAEFYIKAFDEDALKLNIIPPDVTCKATDYINEQIGIISELEKKGYTYRTEDGIYFDTTKFDDYAKLGKLNIKGLIKGHRTDARGKKNKTDFALWKFSGDPGIRQQEWSSPWGIGFPGWHTECVVMATEHLGRQFDIHTGGEDHVQVHHTNEIAQAECAYEKKPWVRFWMHGAYLKFEGEKISKSKGGLFTIPELEQKGFSPAAFRYFCMTVNYRKQASFSLEALSGASTALEKLRNAVIELRSSISVKKGPEFKIYKDNFKEAINDDLNLPKALGILWDALKDKRLKDNEKLELAVDFDKILGLGIKDMKEQEIVIPDDIKELMVQRQKARQESDFASADSIRDRLKEKGYAVDDTPDGPKVRKL